MISGIIAGKNDKENQFYFRFPVRTLGQISSALLFLIISILIPSLKRASGPPLR